MSLHKDIAPKAEHIADLLKLIANPNRLMIAYRLLEGEMPVSDIETELGIKQPTLSRELGRLRNEGVIKSRRQSKAIFYSLDHPQLERMLKAICAASLNENYQVPETTNPPNNNITFLARPKFTNSHDRNSGGYSHFASVESPRSKP